MATLPTLLVLIPVPVVTGFDKADALNHLIEISDMGRRAEQKIYQREVSSFMNSFEKFANGLRMIRGRKNLVWFSTGFDARSITGGTTAELQRNQSLIENGQHYNVSADQFGVASIQHEAQELIDQLQSSGTVIFAVDTSLNGDSTTDKPGSHILNMFAEDTGGKAYHSYSDLSKPLDRIQELTNDYYVLSFYPNVEMKKGDIGRVKVKINNNRRARIYTTKGIMVEPDFTKLSRIEKQIHLSEYIGRDVVVSGIPTQVETFQVPVNKNLVKLNVSVELRGDYFLGHKKPRPIEVHTLAISESGELFDRAYFNFQIDPEKTRAVLDKTGVKYFANVFLKPGKYKLKVVARDLETGKVGSSINNINVEDNYDSIHGPTHITEERWVLVRESERSERARRLDKLDHSYPFSVGGSDLVPSSMELISSEEPQSFFYTLSGDASVKETPPNVTALVMDKDGKIMPIPASAMSADAEFVGGPRHVMNFLLKVDLPSMGLKSGESYKLMTQFKTSGGAALRSAADFTLE